MRSVAKTSYRRRVKSTRLLALAEQLRIQHFGSSDPGLIPVCREVRRLFGDELTPEQGGIVSGLLSNEPDPRTKSLRKAFVDLLAAVYCTTNQSVERDLKQTCINRFLKELTVLGY
jgi:hypothetical protein